MKNKLARIAKLTTAAATFCISAANAAEVDIFNVNGQYASVPYSYTAGAWALGGIAVDGTGLNKVSTLYYSHYSTDTGYKYWRGVIPNEAVTVNGVNSIAVDIDTCSISTLAGCGYVSFTVDTNEPASGWVNNGVWGNTYSGYISRYVGAAQARNASSTGTILGHNIDSSRAWIGTMDEVTIKITVGE